MADWRRQVIDYFDSHSLASAELGNSGGTRHAIMYDELSICGLRIFTFVEM